MTTVNEDIPAFDRGSSSGHSFSCVGAGSGEALCDDFTRNGLESRTAANMPNL